MYVNEIRGAVCQSALGVLRAKQSNTEMVRYATHQISAVIANEIARSILASDPAVSVEGLHEPVVVTKIPDVVIICAQTSGLTMLSSFTAVFPTSPIYIPHINTCQRYELHDLPKITPHTILIILDPVLNAIERVKGITEGLGLFGYASGDERIKALRDGIRIAVANIVTAPEVVSELKFFDRSDSLKGTWVDRMTLHTASIDRCLNNKTILPGIGNIASRYFGM